MEREATSPTDGYGPAWNTRSCQSSQRSNSEHEEKEDSADACTFLYEITLHPLVKNTVGERNSSAIKLTTFVCGGASWPDIRAKVFNKYKSKCLGLAKRDDGGAWSVSDTVQGLVLLY
ncbi:unnamed protein product [Aphanomyces euteiches]